MASMPPMTKARAGSRDTKALVKLREQMIEYFARAEKNGVLFSAYRCTYCQNLIPCKVPRKDQVSSKGYWDSAATCLACGKTNFVIEYPSGRTVAKGIFNPRSTIETFFSHKPSSFAVISALTLK